jgi:hypothetical protein
MALTLVKRKFFSWYSKDGRGVVEQPQNCHAVFRKRRFFSCATQASNSVICTSHTTCWSPKILMLNYVGSTNLMRDTIGTYGNCERAHRANTALGDGHGAKFRITHTRTLKHKTSVHRMCPDKPKCGTDIEICRAIVAGITLAGHDLVAHENCDSIVVGHAFEGG